MQHPCHVQEDTHRPFIFFDLSCDVQLYQLQKYLLIATCCKKKLSQMMDIVKKTLGDTHSFLSKFMAAMWMDLPTDTANSQLFLSAAEKTLQ